ncbi:hypothetical protein [Janibacter melonis]|uniref:hypothetical protein n=1 Tax=Janibacter melonis TaxID=262209 RepID=UPI0020950E62|nr:hypothetical protein [Janibacter melonis]
MCTTTDDVGADTGRADEMVVATDDDSVRAACAGVIAARDREGIGDRATAQNGVRGAPEIELTTDPEVMFTPWPAVGTTVLSLESEGLLTWAGV